MAGKRARVDFSPEAILRDMEERKCFLKSIDEFRNKLNFGKIWEYLKSGQKDVSFGVLGLLAIMFGFDTITWIIAALQHVPQAYARRKKLRSTIITEIVNSLCPTRTLLAHQVDEIIRFIEESVPDIRLNGSHVFEKALQCLSENRELNYGAFIAPTVKECLTCSSLLSVPNPPSKCMLFTVAGPKAGSKITLRCQNCKVSYGRGMLSHSNTTYSYYPEDITVKDDLVEVSNVVYMEKRLYNWIPALM